MRNLLLFVFIFSIAFINAQNQTKDSLRTDSLIIRSYPVIIVDSPNAFYTMEQFNQDYLSGYRYFSIESMKKFGSKHTRLIQLFSSLVTIPLTHEEGHRSILTSQSIGAISRPIINSKGAAYVMGVSDSTLITLRQNDLPTYIRLHTAGLESDYMMLRKMDDLIIFGQESKNLLEIEYLFRQLSLLSYYGLSPFPKLNPKLAEEDNELNRDIVGHDVYGTVKNLFRPNETFYRYTDYDDLTTGERKFVTRTAVRSLLNIASPVFFKPLNIIQKENLKLSIGTGYTMAPFGDFIDMNFWMQINKKYNFKLYLREYENRDTWFLGGGIGLVDYKIIPNVQTSITGHFWNQPENFDFNTSKGQLGGAGEIFFKYNLIKTNTGNSMSVDLGLNYKTKGFLPEEVVMDKHLGVRLGVTFNIAHKMMIKK